MQKIIKRISNCICVCVCDSLGMLYEFSGLTKVAIYPTCTNLLQRAVVPAFPVLDQIDTGWQITQLTHKQLKLTNSRCSG